MNTQLQKVFAALIDTAQRTTSLDAVYNDKTGESFAWPQVFELQHRLLAVEQQLDELLVENRWLVATMEWLSDPENKGGITTCRKHNGYGFLSDCAICRRLNAITKARGTT